MTMTYVLLQNLRRNPLRTGLTMAAFALPMAIFVAAISFQIALAQMGQENAKQLRLAVQSKIGLVNMLPERMRREIEALDPDHQRITAVCGFLWFGGKVPGEQGETMSLGCDADTFPVVYSNLEWTEREREEWQRDRRAAVIGQSVAQQYRWQLGQRVTLESTIPPYARLEFNIVKITAAPGELTAFYLRRDYYEEARRAAGFDEPGCNVFWIRCTSLEALRSLQSEIDARFANTPNETKTMDENAFGAQFIEALGDLPGLFAAMAVVVVFIIAMVAGNTMMLSFRERTRELAVFKAIGFQGGRVFRIVLAESLFLAALGALVGIALSAALLPALPVELVGMLPPAERRASLTAAGVALLMAVLIGLVAGLVPAVQALRLNTVAALRRVA